MKGIYGSRWMMSGKKTKSLRCKHTKIHCFVFHCQLLCGLGTVSIQEQSFKNKKWSWPKTLAFENFVAIQIAFNNLWESGMEAASCVALYTQTERFFHIHDITWIARGKQKIKMPPSASADKHKNDDQNFDLMKLVACWKEGMTPCSVCPWLCSLPIHIVPLCEKGTWMELPLCEKGTWMEWNCPFVRRAHEWMELPRGMNSVVEPNTRASGTV